MKLALAVLAGLFAFAVIELSPRVAAAQTAFCPASVPGASGLVQSSGTCTNGLAGAYSGAALASQTLGDLAVSATELQTTQTMQTIQRRRELEAAVCPEGEERVDGVCQPIRPILAAPPATPTPRAAKKSARKPKPSPQIATAPPALTVAPPPPSPFVDRTLHFGTWAQGFGDYQQQSGAVASSMSCCSVPGYTTPIPITLSAKSTTTTAEFLGGVDVTAHSFLNPNDGFVAGVLLGYISQNVKVNDTITSNNPRLLGNGSADFTANVNGPTLGAYLSYFSGSFSNDFAIRNNFYNLGMNYNGVLGFGKCQCFGAVPLTFVAPYLGSASTNVNELIITDDLNYRISLTTHYWVEPTVGVEYVNSSYSNGASALGLANGYELALQGGARIGTDALWGDTHVTTSLTGLVYDNVLLRGNFIQGGGFGINGNILSDENVVQGVGILAVNLDFGHGVSAYAEGDVRGGAGIFGAGGKAGVRLQW
jgi:hypothetical protein